MALIDSLERSQATDPSQSFIVQAPAGSGKTEILTQRFLRLLSTVDAPEQIIALTFTRKAANEMRERIIVALQNSAQGMRAISEHQKNTFAFAEAALARDKKLNWQLLQQPSRLRIITIDSLCQTLTQAIPLQEKQIHYAKISDKPEALYLQAAHNCLTFIIESTNYELQTALKTLLHHLDNRQDYLLSLFCDVLSKRDQWLQPIYQARFQEKQVFEQAIAWIEQHELARFRQSLPWEHAEELTKLVRQLACIEEDIRSPRTLLRDFSITHLDSTITASLAGLLLTSQNTLRKAFDHHVGLKRGVCSDTEYNELKAASKNLLLQLEELPDFKNALLRVKNLPKPEYENNQWNVLQALFTLLPLLIGHLTLVFNEQNTVDFTAIAQQALLALGNEEAPTDLALYLDNTIKHLLVDEFQDTSIWQFQLLSQLVQGWEAHDGRTLFVVGDPMQSIYRFRSAEVGLFLRTQQTGIGPVQLIPLELSCNFRSTSTIVDWVNTQFKAIFPAQNDIESGAVSFHPSVVPTDGIHCNDAIQAFQYETREEEAQGILASICHQLETYPEDDIAILVRSRNQLTHIIKLLREHNIPFQGVDIDLLATLPHLRDVWSLTQALLMPANRLAWLAFLRSPWCGLSLGDLHCVANFAKSKSIYYALSQLAHRKDSNNISFDGQLRINFVFSVFEQAFAHRYQQSLVDWLTQILNALQRERILDSSQWDDLEQYWSLLDQFEQDGQIHDLQLFQQEFNKLYSKKVTPSRLQIMTIHKSKGLEFDCVMLPGLSSKSSNRDKPFFRWLKVPTQQEELLLLSPIKATHEEQCVLYDYLGKLDNEKSDYELQRLLYVAVTRAKKRLYLFDNRIESRQGSFRELLNRQEFISSSKTGTVPTQDESETTPNLYHLPIEMYQQSPLITIRSMNKSPVLITDTKPRLIGIVAHELLQWICTYHPTSLQEIPWTLAVHQLKTYGFTHNALKNAVDQIQNQITQLFQDPIGQWIIKKHDNEQNEYELLTQNNHMTSTKIIDRTFCENNVRWIIDFKTGQEDNQTQAHHQHQVNEYATLLSPSDLPIRCGLYYLSSNHWVAWEARIEVEV